MPKMTANNLMTLESYNKLRPQIRESVMAHKKNRKVPLGENVTLIFEDEMTMRYQVQEMLRAEKIFDEAGIQDEIATYNPLIPDGNNWKATLMIEYPDPTERAARLAKLIGVEDKVWVKVAGFNAVYAIADEDLERATAIKTSSVHFLRFELAPAMIKRLQQGAELSMGVDHPAYRAKLAPVDEAIRASLLRDLTVG